MPSQIHVRYVEEAEIEAMNRVGYEAFRGDASSLALFPERLRIKPDGQDESEYHLARLRGTLKVPTLHPVIAVERLPDGGEEIVGFAIWESPPPPGQAPPTEEEKKKKLESMEASLPLSMDKEAYRSLNAAAEEWVKSVVGEGRAQDYWVLQAIGVPPVHRRKGAGRLLTQWGIDEAFKDGNKDIFVRASEVGRALYESLGFETVSERESLGRKQAAMWKKAKVNTD